MMRRIKSSYLGVAGLLSLALLLSLAPQPTAQFMQPSANGPLLQLLGAAKIYPR